MLKLFKKLNEIKESIEKFITVYFLFVLCCIRYFYFEHNKILGQDKLFLVKPELEHINYAVTKCKLESKHPDLFTYFIKKIRGHFDNPKSLLRVMKISKDNFDYNKDSTDLNIKRMLLKVDSIDNVDKKELVNMAMKNSNKVKYAIGSDGYIVAFSHEFFDGISAWELTSIFFDEKKLVYLPDFYYLPIYNEINTISGLNRTINEGIPKQYLSLDYPQEESSHCNIIKYKIPLYFIKYFKSKSSEYLGEKVSFSLVVASLQAITLFNSTKKKKITFGIVVAFRNNKRFNNFTAMALEITRPEDIEISETNIIKMILLFHKKAKEKFYQVSLFYSLTNVYNLNISINKKIDVLISGMPMCIGKQQTIDKIETKDIYATMPYFTSPVYIFHLTDTNYTFISQHFRTDDIDLHIIQELNEKLNKLSEDLKLSKN